RLAVGLRPARLRRSGLVVIVAGGQPQDRSGQQERRRNAMELHDPVPFSKAVAKRPRARRTIKNVTCCEELPRRREDNSQPKLRQFLSQYRCSPLNILYVTSWK